MKNLENEALRKKLIKNLTWKFRFSFLYLAQIVFLLGYCIYYLSIVKIEADNINNLFIPIIFFVSLISYGFNFHRAVSFGYNYRYSLEKHLGKITESEMYLDDNSHIRGMLATICITIVMIFFKFSLYIIIIYIIFNLILNKITKTKKLFKKEKILINNEILFPEIKDDWKYETVYIIIPERVNNEEDWKEEIFRNCKKEKEKYNKDKKDKEKMKEERLQKATEFSEKMKRKLENEKSS